jgi:hypothetical protein
VQRMKEVSSAIPLKRIVPPRVRVGFVVASGCVWLVFGGIMESLEGCRREGTVAARLLRGRRALRTLAIFTNGAVKSYLRTTTRATDISDHADKNYLPALQTGDDRR